MSAPIARHPRLEYGDETPRQRKKRQRKARREKERQSTRAAIRGFAVAPFSWFAGPKRLRKLWKRDRLRRGSR